MNLIYKIIIGMLTLIIMPLWITVVHLTRDDKSQTVKQTLAGIFLSEGEQP